MAKLLSASDDLKALLQRPDVKKFIKENYITEKLFVDSAVRAKLRSIRAKGVGDDEIIAHLERLKASKARHISQQALIHKRNNHKKRLARARKELDESI